MRHIKYCSRYFVKAKDYAKNKLLKIKYYNIINYVHTWSSGLLRAADHPIRRSNQLSLVIISVS